MTQQSLVPHAPVIRRKLKLFERPAPWVVVSLLGLVGLGVIAALGFSLAAAFDSPEQADLRGYTVSGIILGLIATTLAIFALVYSMRKRAMQESMKTSGSMMTWLWLHVTIGL